MENHDLGMLWQALLEIEATLGHSAAELHPILMGYIALFGIFAIGWISYAVLRNGHALSSGLEFAVRLGLVTMALNLWPWVLGGLREVAITMGLSGSGNVLSITEFADPGAFIRRGFESGNVLWQAYKNNLGWTSFWIGGAYLFAWLAYIAAFMVMAYKVFWWQVDLLLAGIGGLCLIPTLTFRATAFVASGVLSYAANMFARFLLGSLLAGAMWRYLTNLTWIATPPTLNSMRAVDITIQGAVVAVAVVWVLGACFLALNRLAGMLTSGVPGMAGGSSFGSFVRAIVAGGAAMLTAGASAGAGAMGLARGGAAGVQGLVGAAQSTGSVLQALQGGGSGAQRLGEAARTLYAGVRSGMDGGVQARLGQYMGVAQQVAVRSGQEAVAQLMQGQRVVAGRDQTYNGVRR